MSHVRRATRTAGRALIWPFRQMGRVSHAIADLISDVIEAVIR